MKLLTFNEIVTDAMTRRDVTPEIKAAEAVIKAATLRCGDALELAIPHKEWGVWTLALKELAKDLDPYFVGTSAAATEVGDLFAMLRMQGNQAILDGDAGTHRTWKADAERSLRLIRLRTIRYVVTGS